MTLTALLVSNLEMNAYMYSCNSSLQDLVRSISEMGCVCIEALYRTMLMILLAMTTDIDKLLILPFHRRRR